MKKYLWIIIAVAVVLVVWYFVENNQRLDTDLYPTPTSTPSVSGQKGSSSLTAVNITPKTSYTQTTKDYATRVMQFDPLCHIQQFPNLVLKNGLSMMFDNRTANAKTIALDSYKFTLKAYGWAVYSLSSTRLPYKVVVDCGNAQNVGTILLEK